MGGLACRGGEGGVDREHSCLHIPCNMQEVCHTYEPVMSHTRMSQCGISRGKNSRNSECVYIFSIFNVCTYLL